MTEAELIDCLRDCYDPTLRRNIVDLRLVRAVRLTLDGDAPGANISGVPEKYCADLEISARSSDAIAGEQLTAQIRNRLAGLPAISQVNITLQPPAFPILDARVK